MYDFTAGKKTHSQTVSKNQSYHQRPSSATRHSTTNRPSSSSGRYALVDRSHITEAEENEREWSEIQFKIDKQYQKKLK